MLSSVDSNPMICGLAFFPSDTIPSLLLLRPVT